MNKRTAFQSPYFQHAERIGQPFDIIRPMPQTKDDKRDTGALYLIQFSDKVQIEAWPEEIFLGAGWEPAQ